MSRSRSSANSDSSIGISSHGAFTGASADEAAAGFSPLSAGGDVACLEVPDVSV